LTLLEYSPSAYNPRLDGIRFIAIATVVLGHYFPSYAHVLPDASLGVRIFFVLSGFLITGILLRARTAAANTGTPLSFTLRHFYIRRVLRIFPVYYLAVFLAVLLNETKAPGSLIALLSFTSNWWMVRNDSGLGVASPYWSIAVEEQFYLLWPLLMLFVARTHLGAAIIATLAIGLVSKLLAFALGLPVFFASISTFGALDALAAGAVLAYLAKQQKFELIRKLSTAAGWISIPAYAVIYASEAFKIAMPDFVSSLRFCVYPLLGFWLVERATFAPSWRVGRLLEFAPFVYVGRISYGIYAYHMLMYGAASMLLLYLGYPQDAFKGTRQLILMLLTLAFAAASWHFFEAPINRLKNRFPYCREAITRPD
jgi:peptidoglycan/LPS O-acetylase OafA/YrhL